MTRDLLPSSPSGRLATALAIGLLVTVAACHRRHELHVLGHLPSGTLAAGASPPREIAVSFDRPMVADEQVGRELATGPLVIDPAPAGTFSYSDRQTLVFHCAEPLPRSTAYHVVVPAGTRARDGSRLESAVSFSFTTERLVIQRFATASGAPLRWLPPSPRFVLELSQPVRGKEVAAACRFEPSGGAASAIAVQPVDLPLDAPVGRLELEPAAPLPRGQTIRFTCDASLRGSDGPLGLEGPFVAAVSTYGDLAVLDAHPTGEAVDASALDLTLTLSNPVALAGLRHHLSAEPAIPGLDGAWIPDGDGGDAEDAASFHARVEVEPGTRYVIRVADLRDRFGQPLAKAYSWTFQAGDEAPRLFLRDGTFTIERSRPRYALFARNLTHLDVAIAQIPDDRIGALLLKGFAGNSDDDGDGDGEREGEEDGAHRGSDLGARLRGLGLTVTEQRLTVEGPHNHWNDAALDLAALAKSKPAGLFALAIQADEASGHVHEVLANVTNLGLVAKLGPTSGLVWAVHLADGKPAGGVAIEVIDAASHALFHGTTGPDGLVSLPGTRALVAGGSEPSSDEGDEESGPSAPALVVTAREGEDLAALSGRWHDGIAAWSFSLPDADGPTPRVRGFIESDRGLYRPGETVHLKGLARAVDLAGLHVPAERTVDVTVTDAHGDQALDRTVPLSPFGGFALDLPLSTEARLGDWQIAAVVGVGPATTTFADRFSVEEYRPASFEVLLHAAHPDVRFGERASVDVSARYLFGAPVGHGQVAYTIRRRAHFPRFASFDDFSFVDLAAFYRDGAGWASDGERSYTAEVGSGEEALGPDGHALLRVDTTSAADPATGPADTLVETTVSDRSNEAITASTAIVVQRSDFYLGLRPEERVPTAGTPFKVDAVAVDWSGRPIAARAELVATLVSWDCGWRAAEGRGGSYHCDQRSTELARRPVVLDGQPKSVTLTLPRAGTVTLSLRAKDPHGQDVVASDQVWACGAGASFAADDGPHVPLVASQTRYRPGETARLVAQSPLVGATALLTIERDGVLTQTVEPYSPGTAFSIPIAAVFAPNVYASVVLVRGRSGDGPEGAPAFAMGEIELPVDASDRRLSVVVTTDRSSYRPGDRVTAKVAVHDASGAPVAAEVTLAASDEGVLELIGFKTPDPESAFYAPFGLGVATSTQWNRLALPLDPNQDATAYIGDSGGASSGHLRSKFVSTAYWNPALVTGSDGTATATFRAPDNLTAFRLMAAAADAGSRFGAGDLRFTVAKPLSQLPAVPRFLSVGDRASLGVIVTNDTATPSVVTVALESSAVALRGAGARSVQLAGGASQAVRFEVTAPDQAGAATLTFHATMGSERDDLAVTLPVEQPVEDATIVLGEGDGATPVRLDVRPPPDAAPGAGELEVEVDASGLSGIDEGLRYLIQYPYG